MGVLPVNLPQISRIPFYKNTSGSLVLISNVNEVIRAGQFESLYYLYGKISHAQNHKSTNTQPSKSTKRYKRTKIKNALKKTSKGKKVTYSFICVFMLFVRARKRQ